MLTSLFGGSIVAAAAGALAAVAAAAAAAWTTKSNTANDIDRSARAYFDTTWHNDVEESVDLVLCDPSFLLLLERHHLEEHERERLEVLEELSRAAEADRRKEAAAAAHALVDLSASSWASCLHVSLHSSSPTLQLGPLPPPPAQQEMKRAHRAW